MRIKDVIDSEIREQMDFNRNFSYLPPGYEHGILDETYQTTQEIDKLSKEIFELVAEKNYNDYTQFDNFDYIHGIDLSDVNPNNYNELKNFVSEANVSIKFHPKTDNNLESGSYVGYKIYNVNKTNIININYHYNQVKRHIDDLVKNHMNIFNKKYLSGIFEILFHETMIHELQHAFDDYRSQGKYNDKKINTKTSSEKSEIENFEEFRKYINLPHEINAFFSQIITNVQPYNIINIDGVDRYELKNIHDYVREYIKAFGNDNYEKLTDKNKKTVVRWIAKFWHFEKDKFDKY